MYQRCIAIVLRKKTIRRGDRFYTLLCDNGQKKSVLVRSAAQTKSKLAGHLEPGRQCAVMMAPGKMVTHIAGAKMLTDYGARDFSYEKSLVRWSALKLADRFVYGEERGHQIYESLDGFLRWLEGFSDRDKILVGLDIFIADCLIASGLAPNLHSAGSHFSLQDADLSAVPNPSTATIPVTETVKKLLQLLFSSKLTTTDKYQWLAKLKTDSVAFASLHNLLDNYYRMKLD
ncbi:MAG: recombination protein O N-terminal domain-containing protein [Candidatus Komeilibacteria bacterium]|nr:recombination protein O N-terminal domain-containing protein [Candidatus Komeilibacteria bacterium]